MSEGPVLFAYQPEQPFPNSVSLAGEFNSWSPAPLVYSDVSGKFETTLVLEEGKSYRYKFVIDGNWLVAPGAETVWDDGNENSIVRVTADSFVKAEPVTSPEPDAPATEIEAVSGSERPATEPEAAEVKAEASAAEQIVEQAAQQAAPQAAPEPEGTGPESVSASVITSEGYVLVQNGKAAAATDAKVDEDIGPIEAKVNGAAGTKVQEVVAAVASKTEEAAAPVEAEAVGIVESAAECAIAATSGSEEAPNVADSSAAPSDMSSIERVATPNTAITTPEATTPVREDAAKKHLPDTVPDVPNESSSSSAAAPTIPAEPSAELPKEPVIAEAATTGNDVAISIPAETPAQPELDVAPVGASTAYQTATKARQPGILEKIYEFVSTSILGKLFQYVFSIFNRSA
ncbi:hypothetical protein V1525DRAFT_385238 [Lipomyces kononenkoae]|uniref:Uncharacterized protein n=1 Tax=Lipomyces kononenkoae TaxID=34357 RepID=A0ACC3TAH0_LIPKO